MWVHTVFMKSWEWQTKKRILVHFERYSSNHKTASISKWFVGSSKSKNSGSMNNALASETRIRHPPLNSHVFWFIMAMVKPKPKRMVVARDSAVLASNWSNLS
mmetsp:Transcript_9115/g.20601  ORF Transcript_9115/g.20601 Transcript_9115/m.20601 type:complete len:103 (+) Transcript_9115:1064-1372(+)